MGKVQREREAWQKNYKGETKDIRGGGEGWKGARMMVLEAGPNHKVAAMCLETKKMGQGNESPQKLFCLSLFISVSPEFVFCRKRILDSL